MLRRYALVVCWLLASCALAQTCSDIRKFDLKNATIHIGQHDENKASGAFNGPEGMKEVFRLKAGVGFQSDDPTNPLSHDWKVSLTATRFLHPEPSVWIEVIELERDHLTGTGVWSYVLAFTCTKAHLQKLFQFSGELVDLEQCDDHGLKLYQAVWTGDDSHMEPSRHRELLFSWNSHKHIFDSPQITEGPGFEPRLAQ